MPARGHGVTASQKPISEYDRHRGDKIGHHLWIPSVTRKRALRHVEPGTNAACERSEQTRREPEGQVRRMRRRRRAQLLALDRRVKGKKSFVQERLATPMGNPGCPSIFGRKAVRHCLLAEHLTAEYRIRSEGHGLTVDEWKLPAHRPDNHWFDCLVGCAAAA